jgi:hypothetical protein
VDETRREGGDPGRENVSSLPVLVTGDKYDRRKTVTRKGNASMKVRFLSILTVGAVLLGGAALMAPAASASRSPQAAVHAAKPFHVAVPGSITKGYCNYTADAVNDSLSSQNFEASFDAYDDMGAADCKIGRHAKLVHRACTTTVTARQSPRTSSPGRTRPAFRAP